MANYLRILYVKLPHVSCKFVRCPWIRMAINSAATSLHLWFYWLWIFFFIAKFWTQLRLMDVKMSAAIKMPWIPVGPKGLRRTNDSGRNFGHLCCEIARHSTQLIIFNNAYDNKLPQKKKRREEKNERTWMIWYIKMLTDWFLFSIFPSRSFGIPQPRAYKCHIRLSTGYSRVLRIRGLHSISWSGHSTPRPGRLHDSAIVKDEANKPATSHKKRRCTENRAKWIPECTGAVFGTGIITKTTTKKIKTLRKHETMHP